MGKPVLANGRCDVLKGQCIRSGAGPVLRELRGVRRDAVFARVERSAARAARAQRPRVLPRALRLAGDRAEVPGHARPAAKEPATRTIEPLPGWLARRKKPTCRPPRTCSRRFPSGAAVAQRAHDANDRRPRVHQVLATLGYGDAIGHEVLGIQRVLRAAGYVSEIFVETADPRLEHLTIDYRDMVGAVTPDDILIHHFSIGSRASRTAYALPGRMVARLPQHHAARVLHRRPQGPREALLPRPPRADRLHRALGPGARRLRVQPAGARERSASRRPASCRSCRTSSTSTSRRTARSPAISTTGSTNIMFVGRVIPNKKFEDVIRAFHAYRTRHNPRSRLLLVGSYSGFEKYLAMLQGLIARLGTPDVHFLGHVSNEELTGALRRRRPVPLRERARRLLRAADRGVLQARAGRRVRARPRFPPPWTAAACSTRPGIRCTSRGSWRRSWTTRRSKKPSSRSQDAALARLRASDFAGTLLRFVERGRRARRRGRRPGGLGLLAAVRPVRTPRGAAPVPSGGLPGAAGGSVSRPSIDEPMIVNQWVPAAHKGDAIGDSARKVRDMLRAAGHESDLFAMTIDEDLRGDVRPFSDPAARDRGRHDLPFRAALADDRGVRVAARRRRPAVPQHHPGGVLRALRRRHVPARGARPQRAADARRPRRPRARRLGVQPPGARGDGLRADRRDADRRQHRADHQGASPSGAREDPVGRPDQHSVRRPDRPEQADRGPYPARPRSTSATSTATTGSSSSAGTTGCRATTRRSGR